MNLNFRSWANPRQKSAQPARLDRNTTRSRAQICSGHVNENCAAAASDAWAGVMVQFKHKVIEGVVAPEAIASRHRPQTDVPVIPAIHWILAPGVVWRDAPDRQQGVRSSGAVGSPPQPFQPETPAGGCAVTFALVGLDAGTPKRYRERNRTRDQPAAPAISGRRAHPHYGQGCGLGIGVSTLSYAGHRHHRAVHRLLFFPRMLYFAQCRDTTRA